MSKSYTPELCLVAMYLEDLYLALTGECAPGEYAPADWSHAFDVNRTFWNANDEDLADYIEFLASVIFGPLPEQPVQRPPSGIAYRGLHEHDQEHLQAHSEILRWGERLSRGRCRRAGVAMLSIDAKRQKEALR